MLKLRIVYLDPLEQLPTASAGTRMKNFLKSFSPEVLHFETTFFTDGQPSSHLQSCDARGEG